MSAFTAKDVQALRQATGAGMMDAKKALTENDGDFDSAAQWLREKGLAKVAKLADRENTQGTVSHFSSTIDPTVPSTTAETVQELADLVASKGTEALAESTEALENLKIAKKENIELGKVVRFEAAS